MKIKKIKSHFRKVDSVIHEVIIAMDLKPLAQPKKSADEYFAKLCREIIGQQLAGKAAKAITGRFFELFEKKKPSFDNVLAISDQRLRNVGMSWAKVKYLKNLAQKTKEGEVKLDKLHDLDDKKVVEELIKVKGIGPWTAEMFLIFTLGREDVFSLGDLGLRKGIKKLYGFDPELNENKTNQIVNQWSPYRSYGCLALWKSVDG